MSVNEIPKNRRCPLPPYPRGWYWFAFSNELPRGAVKPVRYFGEDLVLFRGEDGKVSVLDAYCPHLGAHLGHGGQVDGGCLRCPFHGWKFDGDGQCVDVPYAKKVPPRAQVRSWPVREENGLVLAYYPPDETPTWEIPPLAEYHSNDWGPFDGLHRTVRVHIQEMMENIVDVAHFPVTHHFEAPESRNESIEIDGPAFVFRATHGVRVLPSRILELFGLRHSEAVLEATLHGLGYLIARTFLTDARMNKVRSTTLQLATPIDENECVIHQLTSTNKLFHIRPLDRAIQRFAQATAKTAIMADIPIWENKIYRTTPMLADGDGPIIKFRRWARQFYEQPRAALEA
jgi:phenylpropionate dioxygenase-like ring-hydroxylating dioxygenase large terminal subunit